MSQLLLDRSSFLFKKEMKVCLVSVAMIKEAYEHNPSKWRNLNLCMKNSGLVFVSLYLLVFPSRKQLLTDEDIAAAVDVAETVNSKYSIITQMVVV